MPDMAAPVDITPGQTWEIDLFRPEDAIGVVRLFRTVYGEGYPVQAFVDPEELIRANAEKRIISSVVRTPSGDIVGHNAMFLSAPYHRIYEAGAGLVHPLYRSGGIVGKAVAHGRDLAADAFGLDALFGESVCNHTHMQKVVLGLGGITCAVEVDLMPAEAYTREKSAPGRVSALMDYICLKNTDKQVFIPDECRDFFQMIYSEYPEIRHLKPSADDVPSHLITELSTSFFEFAGVARISIQTAGHDLADSLNQAEISALSRGATVIQIWANLSWPWIGRIVHLLHKKGYFAGGVLPRWFDDDGILLQKLSTPPDWENIRLHADRAGQILEFVRKDYRQFCSGK
jgi:hypothetical protein